MGEPFDSKAFLASLTDRPGVYRMLDGDGGILYVGKARNLRKRVATYFGSKAHHPKTQALMAHAARVEVTVTGTEQEALLLEYNLIKQHRPRFNVVLRDDKSYPLIYVSTEQEFPRFEFHRGSRKAPGRYLGPWPGAGAVRETLMRLQKLFRVRQCTDAFFAARTRPCLQYQIGRCTAPCVGLISAENYRRDVDAAILFLEGRNETVLAGLIERMEQASAGLDFEQAAALRDQVKLIQKIQAEQVIAGKGIEEADVIGVHQREADGERQGATMSCVAVVLIRGGRVLGSRTWFPRASAGTAPDEIITAFITQHYFHEEAPREILVPELPHDTAMLETVLAARQGHPVRIRARVRGTRRRWLEMAQANAAQGLASRLAANATQRLKVDSLVAALGLEEPPERIECFDISHTGGGETVAACVVFNADGPLKSDYRRFNIRDIEPGDDYAAIAQAVERRFARIQRGESPMPDLLLIDGGRGQVDRAKAVLEEYQLGHLPVVGVAKGRDRRVGEEKLVFPGEAVERTLPADSPALLLIQQVRDEAHRFAITGHRQRRGRQRLASSLEAIEGLGPQRRRALLRQFGGLPGIRQAGVVDLAKVPGISRTLAQRIYDHLHGGPAQTV